MLRVVILLGDFASGERKIIHSDEEHRTRHAMSRALFVILRSDQHKDRGYFLITDTYVRIMTINRGNIRISLKIAGRVLSEIDGFVINTRGVNRVPVCQFCQFDTDGRITSLEAI